MAPALRCCAACAGVWGANTRQRAPAEPGGGEREARVRLRWMGWFKRFEGFLKGLQCLYVPVVGLVLGWWVGWFRVEC